MATTATARRAHRPRTVAPKATTQAEAPATAKPSVWTRIKTAAKKTAAVIAKPFKAVATVVAKPFKALAKKAKPASKKAAEYTRYLAFRAKHAVKPATNKVVTFARRLWVRGLRTLLRTVLVTVFAFTVILGLLLAPIPTLLTLVLGAGAMFALAALLTVLEDREATSRAARITLRVLDIIARLVRFAVYSLAAVLTVAMMYTSLSFSVFVVGALIAAYYDSAFGVFLAFAASCIISGNWLLLVLDIAIFGVPSARKVTRTVEAEVEVPEYSEIRRKPEVRETVVRATDARPTGSFLRAQGTEELWGTAWDTADYGDPDRRPNSPAETDEKPAAVWTNDTACSACGTTDGQLRAKSHRRPGDGEPEAWLCSDCFDAECEDEAIRFTGVSLKERSVEVRLNQAGIEASPQFAASKADTTTLHWMEVAWWRDRAGDEHPREKICLMDGLEVARIVHDYKRKVYRASVLGQLVKNGVKTSWALAQRAAEDELMDEGAAVRRYEDAAVEVVGAPARAQSKRG